VSESEAVPVPDALRVWCLRCRHTLVDEDDVWWYYQVPVEMPEAPGLVFMDRVHRCEGLLHLVDAAVMQHVREQRRLAQEAETERYKAWLASRQPEGSTS
jgi:hypothetical protein